MWNQLREELRALWSGNSPTSEAARRRLIIAELALSSLERDDPVAALLVTIDILGDDYVLAADAEFGLSEEEAREVYQRGVIIIGGSND